MRVQIEIAALMVAAATSPDLGGGEYYSVHGDSLQTPAARHVSPQSFLVALRKN